jgi:RND family efflux transporter MFP subunit
MKILNKTVLGMISCAVFVSCSSEKSTEKAQPPVRVEVYTPSQATNDGIYISGQVTAQQTASISTRMMGYIRKIYVKPGDKVAAGQLLVSVKSDELAAQKAQVQAMITEAEAAAKNAQRDYERYKILRSQNSVSDKELENISLHNTSMQAKVQMARQQMNEVNAMFAYSNIRAPFSGTITQKLAEEGSMANPGIPILVLEQSGELEVEASVPENYIQYVKVGDVARIELKSIATTVDGKITELSPSAFKAGGQYAVKLSINSKDNRHIRSGMYVNVVIPHKIVKQTDPSTVIVELSSIIYRDQLTGVYVVDDHNQANLRWVRLGKISGAHAEILSGVEANDRIVLKAEGKLYNGRKVTIVK